MVEVTEELTRKVGNLARLELTEAEVSTFTLQLQSVLHYVEQIQQVELTMEDGRPIEPLYHLNYRDHSARIVSVAGTPLREDEVTESRPLNAGPNMKEGCYQVPPIL